MSNRKMEGKFRAFIRILNRLDGQALFESDKDIAKVLRMFRANAEIENMQNRQARLRAEIESLKSLCNGKVCYGTKEEAYRAAAKHKQTPYLCETHGWHLTSTKKGKKTNKKETKCELSENK